MTPNLNSLKAKLDKLALEKNTAKALFAAPDPLQVASAYEDEFICLICALFAYGNAGNIVKFLRRLDFSLLDESEVCIKKSLKGLKYRFQSEADVVQIFITLRRLKQQNSLKNIFLKGFAKGENVADGLRVLINEIYAINDYTSLGYEFFFSKPFVAEPQSPMKRYNMLLRWLVRKDGLDLGLWNLGENSANLNKNSAKNSSVNLSENGLNLSKNSVKNLVNSRENSTKIPPSALNNQPFISPSGKALTEQFTSLNSAKNLSINLVKNCANLSENLAKNSNENSVKNLSKNSLNLSENSSNLSVNLSKNSTNLGCEIKPKHLLIPLDTHTHKVALNFGLLSRKSYDFKAVLELTQILCEFDPQDPIKYDFALYRLGQSKEYLNFV